VLSLSIASMVVPATVYVMLIITRLLRLRTMMQGVTLEGVRRQPKLGSQTRQGMAGSPRSSAR
jgi:hypothetical protein